MGICCSVSAENISLESFSLSEKSDVEDIPTLPDLDLKTSPVDLLRLIEEEEKRYVTLYELAVKASAFSPTIRKVKIEPKESDENSDA